MKEWRCAVRKVGRTSLERRPARMNFALFERFGQCILGLIEQAKASEIAGDDVHIGEDLADVEREGLILEQGACQSFAGLKIGSEAPQGFGGGAKVFDGGVDVGLVRGEDLIDA